MIKLKARTLLLYLRRHFRAAMVASRLTTFVYEFLLVLILEVATKVENGRETAGCDLYF